jgi:phosphoserine aminotransferase
MTNLVSPALVIPAELKPADGRFGSGPARIRPAQLAALAASGGTYLGTSHRQPPVRSLVRRIRAGLAELFGLPADFTVALGNGGTSAFWEIATFGLIREHSQHLSFGEFSARFAALAARAPWLSEPSVVESAPGRHPATADPRADTYALTHNETSTGVAMPVHRVPAPTPGRWSWSTRPAPRRPRCGPRSSTCTTSPRRRAWAGRRPVARADVATAVERVHEIAASGRYVPDFSAVDRAGELGQGPDLQHPRWRPCSCWPTRSTGCSARRPGLTTARTARSAAILYTWAEKASFADPFVADPAQRSQVVGTIDIVGDGNGTGALAADDIAATLRVNGIVDTEPYRKLGRNQLRVGMFPAVDPADVEALTACIDYVTERLAG